MSSGNRGDSDSYSDTRATAAGDTAGDSVSGG